jgi:hypothetical protein
VGGSSLDGRSEKVGEGERGEDHRSQDRQRHRDAGRIGEETEERRRQPAHAVTKATQAGQVTLPRSPEKLYVPMATRRRPASEARETNADDNGCWVLAPRPPIIRNKRSGTKPPAVPTQKKPTAVRNVPAIRIRGSPYRSARYPAGTWKRAWAPEYPVRSRPTCTKERENSRAHGEENVQEIGASVMQEVEDAACGERGPSTLRDNDGDSFNRFSNCQARDE